MVKKKTTKKATKRRGRPSKYKNEYCELLIEHLESGLSYEAFAGVIKVHLDTLYEWEKVHPNFSEAKRIGVQAGRLFWEKMGRAGAAGKIKNFNCTAWIFNMKNRFGWRDKQDVNHSGGVDVLINIDTDDADL